MKSIKMMFLGYLVMFFGLTVHFSLSTTFPIDALLVLIGFIIALVGFFRKA